MVIPITTAEHAIALLFAAAQQIAAADASTQVGQMGKRPRFMGIELYAKTLGLIGCGNIGALVAERALALKMKVIAYDPFLSPERSVKLGVEKLELDELLSRADLISLHTPLTDKTRNILSKDALARTKPGVIIVNAARGGLVGTNPPSAPLSTAATSPPPPSTSSSPSPPRTTSSSAPGTSSPPPTWAPAPTKPRKMSPYKSPSKSPTYLLAADAVTNALNTPTITAEESSPPQTLYGLGREARAASPARSRMMAGIEAVEIEYEGDVAQLNTQPLTAIAPPPP